MTSFSFYKAIVPYSINEIWNFITFLLPKKKSVNRIKGVKMEKNCLSRRIFRDPNQETVYQISRAGLTQFFCDLGGRGAKAALPSYTDIEDCPKFFF